MHATTLGFGYPADSSDLAAGAVAAATSTPSLLQSLSDHCLLLRPVQVACSGSVRSRLVRDYSRPAPHCRLDVQAGWPAQAPYGPAEHEHAHELHVAGFIGELQARAATATRTRRRLALVRPVPGSDSFT